jgi:hypothetical protein
MKKLLTLLVTIFLGTQMLLADSTPLPSNTITQKTLQRPKVRLEVQAAQDELEPYGIKLQELEASLTSKLNLANILVESNPQNPLLLLRMKTVETGGDLATFVQLAFFEEAELARNKSIISAITWSQASLLTTTKKDFSSEVTKTVESMLSSFIIEYNKAFAS